MIERILAQGFSEGTEEFREALLQRCLDALNDDESYRSLSDGDLDMLAAAGVVIAPPEDPSHD